jgi:hypothetical protein
MSWTFPQVRKAAGSVAEQFNITEAEAVRILSHFAQTDEKALQDIIAGDFSEICKGAAVVGVNLPGMASGRTKTNKTASDSRKKKEPPKVEKVAGEILPAGVNAEGLPDGFADKIEGWLFDFSQRYGIELEKASGQQWRSACIYIGHQIQETHILEDAERERKEGGKIYNPKKIESLLYLWEYITGLYKHTPLVADFVAFSGVSRGWFYDYEGRGLTSASVQISKKARDIEEAGLSSGLTDGRENPTGRIFYAKARRGWTEAPRQIEITHTSASAAAALPVFSDAVGGLIAEKGTESP